jgi:hypothetical protein
MDPQYVQAKGIINYTNKPQMMQLFLYPTDKNGFYYSFFTNDGFQVKLKPGYEKFLHQIGADTKSPGTEPSPSETPSSSPSATDFQATYTPEASPSESPEEASPTPTPEESPFYDFPELGNQFRPESKLDDGTLVFSRSCPLNLVFPFTFKTIDPDAKLKYIGTEVSQGFRCNIIEMESAKNGIYRIYITDDKDSFIVQVDQRTPGGVVYASAYYSDFKLFRKGGWFYQNVKLIVLSQSTAQGVLTNVETNDDKKIVGDIEETPQPRRTMPKRPGGGIDEPGPIWQIGTIVGVIVLLLLLTFFFYRYWFYKAKREPFAREVIVVEGDRPEEKISHLLADMGIPSTAFTSEKLTEERKLLDQQQGGKRPRVVVIAPGMFSQVKPFNFLIKAYVQDGGRVIIFEHGVEQTNDMPFTPTFMPYDKTDPNLVFLVHPQWEKIWRQTSIEEIKKRTAAFYPYELIARVKEKTIDIEPIIYATNPKTDFNAVAVAMLKEGKGEYMIVQYRLLEAIKKLKFTSATAEKMLLDLISYMFGDEKRIAIAPEWLLGVFGLGSKKSEAKSSAPKKK